MQEQQRLTRVTKSVEFDYGHRVPHHASKCRNWHGHRGKVEVEVIGPLVPEGAHLSDEGMVIDFTVIKEALNHQIVGLFDHAFLIECDDARRSIDSKLPNGGHVRKLSNGKGIWLVQHPQFGDTVMLPYVPTAENLAYICYLLLAQHIDCGDVKVASVRFWETSTSVAEYRVI